MWRGAYPSAWRAQEAYDLLRSGAMKGLSIGYKPVTYDFDENTGVRYLREVDLFEVSLVTFPANEEAQVTVVKSGDQPMILALAESVDRAIASLKN